MSYGPPPAYLSVRAWTLFGFVADGDLDSLGAALAEDPQLGKAQSFWPAEVDPFAVAIHCNQLGALERLAEAVPHAPLIWSARHAERLGFEDCARFALELDARRPTPHDPAFHELRAAIIARDLGQAESIAAANPRLVNGVDEDGNGSLYWATHTRNLVMIDRLIALGADVKTQCGMRHPPHHAPLRLRIRGSLDPKPHHVSEETVLAYLVAKGVPYDLTTASRLGDLERVQTLLVSDPGAVHVASSHGQTALGQAARSGHVDLVRLLLKAGADPNLPVYGAECGAAVFAALGNAEMMELLLEHGADPNAYADSTGVPLEFVEAADVRDLLCKAGAVTPAYQAESIKALQSLLDEPVEALRARDSTGWGGLLPQIVQHGDVATLDRYVERLGSATVGQLDPFNGHHVPKDNALLGRLLHHGLDPNRRDAWGCTFLHHSQSAARTRLLLDHGASVDPVDFGHGRTPLAYAIVAEDLDRVAVLRQHGANPDEEGRRPKHSPRALAGSSDNPAVRAAFAD